MITEFQLDQSSGSVDGVTIEGWNLLGEPVSFRATPELTADAIAREVRKGQADLFYSVHIDGPCLSLKRRGRWARVWRRFVRLFMPRR